MISRIWKEMQKKKRDNKGAALVMVIIAIAFIGMLVGMILYMAYCNYLMKANDTQAKDNFYTAEYALDVIHAGLQMDISEAMSEAYVIAMKDSAGKDSEAMEILFQQEFADRMQKKLQATDALGAAVSNKWDIDHLKDYWVKNGMTPASIAGETGPYLEAEGGDNSLEIATANEYIMLGNLKIVYTDEKGYVSIITTNLRIQVPTVGFAQSASKMSIENFALIANEALVNDASANVTSPDGDALADGSNVRISGNVFGGYDGVYVANQTKTSFVTNATDAAGGTPVSYKLIANSLNVSNSRDTGRGLDVAETFETRVNNIRLEGGRLDLDGTAYVGNDLDVGGLRSAVKLSGKYYGYGNAMGESKNSSSILVNGGSTSLDFGDLDELFLSGHAYVGATKYDADVDRLAYSKGEEDTSKVTGDEIEDEEEYNETVYGPGSIYNVSSNSIPENSIPTNDRDLMMGESISVKANQLLYMVPEECVGYNTETGEQIIAKNPMTYAEYEILAETEVQDKDEEGKPLTDVVTGEPVMKKLYDLANLAPLWNKLGGIAYTNDYKAVFRRVNGTVLVYLYLDFGSNETMANEFYKAYYEYDPEGISDYVKSYISDMTWNSSLAGAGLTLGGNAFYLNRNDEVVFVDDSMQDPVKYANMLLNQTEYANEYTALMQSLDTDYEALTSAQLKSQIFDTLVDDTKFDDMNGKQFKTAAGDIQARISSGSLVYPSTNCPSDTKLIVSQGDIFIKGDFSGLAIAKGKIYICSGCSTIDYNPQDVLQAMRASVTLPSGDDLYAYEIFGVNGSVTYGVDSAGAKEEKIELQDLITYENWEKE